MTIGFIGTGTISRAMVEGLCLQASPPAIIVSPRSEANSLVLAARHANVTRATSNAEVARADVVVLGMRPAQVEEALDDVDFAPGQIVLSLVAGLDLAALRRLVPHARLARALPLPGISRRVGPIAVYPSIAVVLDMLRPLGDLFAVAEEGQLGMGGATAFLSSYFELQNRLVASVATTGIGQDEARRFVVSLLHMLADTARVTAPEQFPGLVLEHQTKGGLNERVRASLLAAGWFDMLPRALGEAAALNWKKLG